MIDLPASSGTESARVSEARVRARQRLSHQRDTLRPLGFVVVIAVAVSAISGHPAPGLHGKAIGVTLALCAVAGTIVLAIRGPFTDRGYVRQVVVIAAMGAAGVALIALQPRGATALAGGAAVWMAVTRLPLAVGVALAVAVTVALDVAAALSGASSAGIVAATLLCSLLGFVAYFLKQARANQDRAEVLLAQLEDAREQQLEAAAIAERGRIASELHDVLAHSLSGAAIQLQGARALAGREPTSAEMRSAIDRASELVKEGLANARQAVGALRGEELPGIAQIDSLIESFRNDMHVEVTLTIEGSARTLPAEASLALYRGAQEALTNVARYAPGAVTSVVLRYEKERTSLIVDDRLPAGSTESGLVGVGGGRGLTGMRERLEHAGGHMHAGPTETGWRVELDVPA